MCFALSALWAQYKLLCAPSKDNADETWESFYI